jgi:hypothetical protein
MLLDKLSANPAKVIPVAMALLSTGLMLLVFAILWPKSGYLSAHVGPDTSDFLRGLLYGISITFEIASVVILVKFAAAKPKKA